MRTILTLSIIFSVLAYCPCVSYSAGFDWGNEEGLSAAQNAALNRLNGKSSKNDTETIDEDDMEEPVLPAKKQSQTRRRNPTAGGNAINASKAQSQKGTGGVQPANSGRKGLSIKGKQQNLRNNNSLNKKNFSNGKKNQTGEIDQLPLPERDEVSSTEPSVAESVEEEADSPTVIKKKLNFSHDESRFNNKSSFHFSNTKKKNNKKIGDSAVNYEIQKDWEANTRAGHGNVFAVKKEHVLFTVYEMPGECSPESVLAETRKELSKFKPANDVSKLRSYAAQDGISGYYFSFGNRDNTKSYFSYICADELMLKAELTGTTEESLFYEAMRSIKLGSESGNDRKGGSSSVPKLKKIK